MAYRKLNLDRDKIDQCRNIAARIVSPVQKYIDRHSTTSIERSVLRVFGVEDAHDEMPHANLIVDRLSRDMLRPGIAWWFARAAVHTGLSAKELGKRLACDQLSLDSVPNVPEEKIRQKAAELAEAGIRRMDQAKSERLSRLSRYGEPPQPWKYLIVATGNIHDDAAQAASAVEEGADIIAVIRTTAQSLLDYVPDGVSTEGAGGTLATQANFRVMRKALDDASAKAGRYIKLVNYSSGLCMSEIAAMAAVERLDVLLNDSMYGILFRDINMKRTFVDQYFSRLICARAGITINTGEDNYLTTTDAYRNAHHVLASQFINEQFALKAGLPHELMGLGHAFEMDPSIEDGFLFELAQAQMVREIFPRSPIKFMPPTKHMKGDILFGNVMDVMFNVCGIITEQSIQLLGIPTEAIHNPHIQDRYWALKNANYVFGNCRNIGDEISFNPNGKIARRAHTVLENAHRYLKKIEAAGLMKAISQGMFADIEREENGGKGLEGVFQKDQRYLNPVLEMLKAQG
ncbi:MAG: lysine 5,6-aminomutase subunit alpha [Proteobacteria bacterium]|nr:lysine 5,6-aminomutase subunit alpha [Pseudomonadota bacterium]